MIAGRLCVKSIENARGVRGTAPRKGENRAKIEVAMALTSLLKSTFGFSGFRANQEAVCEAATDGRDVLLVMPTGAGKSLCYQLPVLARGGTGLVVSPLIALMDDQAQKLTAAGLKVARIHSGLSREDSRQACRDYLDGKLQFLFIAPERMRVPGFPEMLARKKPSLIAIDEAHCISAWGHDFRPDYRMLGDYLPSLRPAPIIALTATATPAVQKDIVTQLQLQQPALFIHGFRRDNLSIEVVELSKPQRMEFTAKFLADKSRRPAIVYAPSRKAAEELADELGRHFPAAAYHAGLESAVRERVQRNFQIGKLEVVVATIAFGMGIDKADVRTVVHYALPASVEAYYQEIGRAGRDGKQSRTVLLYSFADRKMHDFFLERDYPVATDLKRVASALTDEEQMPDILRQKLRMDAETFDRVVEKLAAQGAAAIDIAGNVRRLGNRAWQSSYEQQVEFRRSQIDRMVAYATTQQCRMGALIRHFGDIADAHRPCGYCDFCAPGSTAAQTSAEPSSAEDKHLRAILRALEEAGGSKATGRLFTDLALTRERNDFEVLIDGLARAGLVSISNESFTNPEGRIIPYKKAVLTLEGHEIKPGTPLGVVLRGMGGSAGSKPAKRIAGKRIASADPMSQPELSPAQRSLEAELRNWRKQEAAKTGKPAFIVFGDAALTALSIARPQTIPELLTVSGFGKDKAERYGAEICAICRAGGPGLGSQETDLRSLEITTSQKTFKAQPPVHAASSMTGTPRLRMRTTADKHKVLNDAANARMDFESDLRLFATKQSRILKLTVDDFFSEAALAELLTARPSTKAEIDKLSKLRNDLPAGFYTALAEICSYSYKKDSRTVQKATSGLERDLIVRPAPEVFRRERTATPEPDADLSDSQKQLEDKLRAWRKAESERMGLPQFFVLGTTTLRSIVLERPRTLQQLEGIQGLGQEKLDRFGASILEVCNG